MKYSIHVTAKSTQLCCPKALYHYPTLHRVIDFSIVRLELQTTEQFDNMGGERNDLLTSFCKYQGRKGTPVKFNLYDLKMSKTKFSTLTEIGATGMNFRVAIYTWMTTPIPTTGIWPSSCRASTCGLTLRPLQARTLTCFIDILTVLVVGQLSAKKVQHSKANIVILPFKDWHTVLTIGNRAPAAVRK